MWCCMFAVIFIWLVLLFYVWGGSGGGSFGLYVLRLSGFCLFVFRWWVLIWFLVLIFSSFCGIFIIIIILVCGLWSLSRFRFVGIGSSSFMGSF